MGATQVQPVDKLGAEARIRQGWDRPDFPLSDAQISALSDYLQTLNRWNRVHSLTAIEGLEDQVTRHILDAMAVWPEIVRRFGPDPDIRIADVGSGMGVPGIVWAVVMPQSRIDLVERSQKKSAFLRQVCGQLNFQGRVDILTKDVKQMALKEMSQSALAEPFGYDLITSRAFAAPSDFLDKTYAISNQHTQWAALIGRLDPEICEHTLIKMNNKKSYFLVDEVKKIEVPYLHEDRHLIWIRRSS